MLLLLLNDRLYLVKAIDVAELLDHLQSPVNLHNGLRLVVLLTHEARLGVW